MSPSPPTHVPLTYKILYESLHALAQLNFVSSNTIVSIGMIYMGHAPKVPDMTKSPRPNKKILYETPTIVLKKRALTDINVCGYQLKYLW